MQHGVKSHTLQPVLAHDGRQTATQVTPASAQSENKLRVAAFDKSVRRPIARMIATSPRVAEIAEVFPGVLFALAIQRGALKSRRRALAMIRAGEPLKHIAAQLGLPMWMRPLPARAYTSLPDIIPDSRSFATHIAMRYPKDNSAVGFWLESVLFAHRACDETFAIWLAEQDLFKDQGDAKNLFAVLAAYAWFSQNGDCAARALIRTPWHPDIGFYNALCAAKAWFNRMVLTVEYSHTGRVDAWLTAGDAHGFTFKPLLTAPDLLDHANAMDNCTDQFSERLSWNCCRLFSMSCEGRPVASIEIAAHPIEKHMLTIIQFKGIKNMPLTEAHWRAAYAWLGNQSTLTARPLDRSQQWKKTAGLQENTTWRKLIAPYRKSIKGDHGLPIHYSRLMVGQLNRNLYQAAQRGRVHSWLFESWARLQPPGQL